VPDATFDSLIHRQFVRNDVGSICHKKQIYWDLSESLPEKCAMSVLWDFRERGNINSITISKLWCPEVESNHRHEDFQ